MRVRLLDFLVCPKCQCRLNMTVSHQTADEIAQGTLRCPVCDRDYPIVRGIPRFVGREDYAASFGYQWTKYAKVQLDSFNNTDFSRQRFFAITEWEGAELKAKLVLDAGCGSGRFSEIALETGAEVIAVDISRAIDSCQKNLEGLSTLHCVQASIYELPFRNCVFDYAFSIGVIQHCPDPRAAVLRIVEKVKAGGKAALWIYELSWKSFFGTVGFKYLLRPLTKRLSRESLERFAIVLEKLCWPINRVVRNGGYTGRIIMRVLPVSCAHLQGLPLSEEDFREWVRLDTFDMYSPAFDKPQRFSNVARWLGSAGCKVDRRHPHGAISITASKIEKIDSVD